MRVLLAVTALVISALCLTTTSAEQTRSHSQMVQLAIKTKANRCCHHDAASVSASMSHAKPLQPTPAFIEAVVSAMCATCVAKCKECVAAGKGFSVDSRNCVTKTKKGAKKSNGACDGLSAEHVAQVSAQAVVAQPVVPDPDWNAEFMKIAKFIESNTADRVSDFKVGAVIAYNGHALVWGRNDRTAEDFELKDKPLHHAERNAIEQLKLLCPQTFAQIWDGAVVYSSVQPCANCVQAILGVGKASDHTFSTATIAGHHPKKLFYAKPDAREAAAVAAYYGAGTMKAGGVTIPAFQENDKTLTHAQAIVLHSDSDKFGKDGALKNKTLGGNKIAAACPAVV